MTNPNEPTLTCSEVVERLHNCIEGPDYWFDTEQATAILHSWRERRVQELEATLRVLVQEMSDHREFCNDCDDALKVAERILHDPAKLCSSCGDATDYCCADCMIERREKVFVCGKSECRDKHEALKICQEKA